MLLRMTSNEAPIRHGGRGLQTSARYIFENDMEHKMDHEKLDDIICNSTCQVPAEELTADEMALVFGGARPTATPGNHLWKIGRGCTTSGRISNSCPPGN